MRQIDAGIILAAVFQKNQRKSNSQGFNPVCFLKAVEKWEMEE